MQIVGHDDAGDAQFIAQTVDAVIMKHVSETPPPPAALRSGISAELSEITVQMLAKDPKDRPQTAREVVFELTDICGRTHTGEIMLDDVLKNGDALQPSWGGISRMLTDSWSKLTRSE